MTDPSGWWFHVPIATISAANAREHWAAKARRVRFERHQVWVYWNQAHNAIRCRTRKWAGWRVTLTRFSPGSRALDSDNLPAALKAIRDELAACLGVDDGDPRITWEYQQTKGAYGVRVELQEAKLDRHAVDEPTRGAVALRADAGPGPAGEGAGGGGRGPVRSAPTG